MKKGEKILISKDMHCPYCQKDKAVLIHEERKTGWSLQCPAYGLKFIFSVLYLWIFYILRYGMKLFEVVRKNNALTYVFCPECGNSYSMKPPADISVEIQDDRLYKYEYGKVLKGVCKGISVLTEIPLLWIRIMSVIYGIAAVATIENVLSDLLTTFLFYIGWFDPDTLTSNLYKYIWPIWWYIVALVIVVGCYFLFSAMLKTKQREEVQ